MNKIKIKKGDKVVVLSGKDKGKTGEVEKVITKERKIVVSKVNILKKHVKVSKENPAGGILEVEKAIPVSKVELVCPSCGKRTRVGYEKKGKTKSRVCKKCNKSIDEKKINSESTNSKKSSKEKK